MLEVALAFAKENRYTQVPTSELTKSGHESEPFFTTSERFSDALEAISHEKEITTAFVQKLLQCDYGHASATIDWLIEKKMIEEIPDSHKYKVTFLLPVELKI